MSGVPRPFKDQDYDSLKKKHNRSNLFVDPYFPANIKSICHLPKQEEHYSPYKIEWKRPFVYYYDS